MTPRGHSCTPLVRFRADREEGSWGLPLLQVGPRSSRRGGLAAELAVPLEPQGWRPQGSQGGEQTPQDFPPEVTEAPEGISALLIPPVLENQEPNDNFLTLLFSGKL